LGLFDSGPTSSPSPSPSPESTITPQLASAFPDLVMKTKVSTQTHEDIAKALDVGYFPTKEPKVPRTSA
jgi:hypothetical protein